MLSTFAEQDHSVFSAEVKPRRNLPTIATPSILPFKIKCCVDQLRPPPKADIELMSLIIQSKQGAQFKTCNLATPNDSLITSLSDGQSEHGCTSGVCCRRSRCCNVDRALLQYTPTNRQPRKFGIHRIYVSGYCLHRAFGCALCLHLHLHLHLHLVWER